MTSSSSHSLSCYADFVSFGRLHQPIQSSSGTPRRNLSHASLPNSFAQLTNHDVSDGGLATSTQRLAVNTGYTTSQNDSSLFGPRARPIYLPSLNAFLSKLKSPSFSQWIDVLTTEEIGEYQLGSHRRFPLLHLIENGVSLSDLKSNKLKLEVVPGLENDCWRFLVDVIILTAGSPYGKYMTVDIFRLYALAIISIFFKPSREDVARKVFAIIGGGSMGIVVTFLVFLLLVYKCFRMRDKDVHKGQYDLVNSVLKMFS